MATIRDVAKLAGVGIGTVSRVLSGKGSVSPKTLLKVNQAMEVLKFHTKQCSALTGFKKNEYYWHLGY